MIAPAGSENGADRQPSAVPWDGSRRLWSLGDVIKQSIWRFVNTGIQFHNFQRVLDAIGERQNTTSLTAIMSGLDDKSINARTKTDLGSFIDDLFQISLQFDLPTASILLMVARDDPPRTSRELRSLILAVRTEIHKKLFLYIPSERSSYYEKDDILSDRTKNAFPNAYIELREAANCYAAERYTACVFHSMRAAEIGLRSLGADLGVSFPDKPIELAEWHNIIEKIESEIKKLLTERVTNEDEAKARDSNRQFYSQAAAQFRYFKDGWRIRVAHARETYTGSQALNVLEHARAFFEELAERLAEPL